MIKKKERILLILSIIFIGVFFSIWALIPRFGIIRIIGQDLEFHLSRIIGLKESIYYSGFGINTLIHHGLAGYGYANGMFYGNLLVYIPALFNLMGFRVLNSYRILIIFINISTAFSMFWCVKSITKSNKIGIFASFIYSASAYRICDLIFRASIGELGAFIFLPIVILGLYEIIYRDYKKWYIFSIGFVLLAQSHIISTVIMSIITVIIILINYKSFISDKKRLFYLILSGVVGILVGSYFLFSLLEGLMKNDLVVSSRNSSAWKHTIPIERLFLGFPYDKYPYYADNGSFCPPGIGIIYIILISFRFKIKEKKDTVIKFCDLCILMGFSTLICTTALFPWKEIEFMHFVQFPWRIYVISTLFFTIAGSIIVYYLLKKKNKSEKLKFILPVIFLAIIPYILFFYYNGIKSKSVIGDYDGFTIAAGEYLPNNTNVSQLLKRGEVVTSNNKLNVNLKRKGEEITVNYKNNTYTNTYVDVPLLYYSGYRAYDSKGKELKLIKGKNNIVRIYLDDREGQIKVSYSGTNIQRFTFILSIISIIGLILYIFRNKLILLVKK